MASAHIQLVRTDDPGYRAFLSQQAARTRSERGHRGVVPPAARATIGAILERGARSLLGDRLWLDDRRILTWISPGPSTTPQRLYKEIDAVAFGGDGPTLFGEVKTGTTLGRCVRAAGSQHAHVAHVVGDMWPGFTTLTIAMPWSDEEDEQDFPFIPAPVEVTWDTVAELPGTGARAMVTLEPERAWERAVERGWAPDPNLFALARENLQTPPRETPQPAATVHPALGAALGAAFARKR
jgi:hypothetical protein